MNLKTFFLTHTKLIFSVFCLKILYFLSFFGIGVFTYFSIFKETFDLKYISSIVFLLVFGFIVLIFLSKLEKKLRIEIDNFKRS